MQEVTERDLRAPEFRDGEPSDYEFREDGKIVRKDRWEQGIRQIVGILGIDDREGWEVSWEIDDAVKAVGDMRDRLNTLLMEKAK
jgi:hypothetical protein